MSVYSDLYNSGNTSGYHYFDGAALSELAKHAEPQADDTKTDAAKVGEPLKVEDAEFVLHRNGRKGERDLSKDTLVFSIEQLAKLPDSVQLAMAPFEKLPEGFVRK